MNKIFFCLDTLQMGGAEQSTLAILSRLPPSIDPVVVSFYKGNDLLPAFNEAGIRVVQFNLPGPYQFRTAIRRFTDLCKREQPKLIVATLMRTEIICRMVAKSQPIPLIGTFVNDTYSKYEIENLSLSRKLKMGIFWLINSFTSRYCHRFLANSESIKASNAKALRINTNRIDVIPRGRDIAKYKYSDKRFLTDKTVFFNVGRLIPRKGQVELIKGFHTALKTHPNIELWIAGGGKFQSELSSLIQSLQIEHAVKLLGNVGNVPELLSKADVFIFPSWYEGFSGAVVEAMLAGVPILASDISMNREAVQHGVSAYLFAVKNEHAIAEAILFALNNKDKMQAFAATARANAVQNFDIEKVAAKHAGYYAQLIAAQSASASSK